MLWLNSRLGCPCLYTGTDHMVDYSTSPFQTYSVQHGYSHSMLIPQPGHLVVYHYQGFHMIGVPRVASWLIKE